MHSRQQRYRTRRKRGKVVKILEPGEEEKFDVSAAKVLISDKERRDKLRYTALKLSRDLTKKGIDNLEGLYDVPSKSQLEIMTIPSIKKFLDRGLKYIEENGLQMDYAESTHLVSSAIKTEEKERSVEKARSSQVQSTKISSLPTGFYKPQTSEERIRARFDAGYIDPNQSNAPIDEFSVELVKQMPGRTESKRTTEEEEYGREKSRHYGEIITRTRQRGMPGARESYVRNIYASKGEIEKNELARDIMSSSGSLYTRLFNKLQFYPGIDAKYVANKLTNLKMDLFHDDVEFITRFVEETPHLTEGQHRAILDEFFNIQKPDEPIAQDYTGSMIPVDEHIDELDKQLDVFTPANREVRANMDDVEPDSDIKETLGEEKSDNTSEVKDYDKGFDPIKGLPENKESYDNSYSLSYGDGYDGENGALSANASSYLMTENKEQKGAEWIHDDIKRGQAFISRAHDLERSEGYTERVANLFDSGESIIENARKQIDKIQDAASDPMKALDAAEQFSEVLKDPQGAAMKVGELLKDEVKSRAEDLARGVIPKDAPGVLDDMRGLLESKIQDTIEGGISEGAGGLGEIARRIPFGVHVPHMQAERVPTGQPVPYRQGQPIPTGRVVPHMQARPIPTGQQVPYREGQQIPIGQPVPYAQAQPIPIGQPVPLTRAQRVELRDNDELRKYTGSVRIKRKPVKKISRRRSHNQVGMIQRGVAESKAYKNVFNSTFS